MKETSLFKLAKDCGLLISESAREAFMAGNVNTISEVFIQRSNGDWSKGCAVIYRWIPNDTFIYAINFVDADKVAKSKLINIKESGIIPNTMFQELLDITTDNGMPVPNSLRKEIVPDEYEIAITW